MLNAGMPPVFLHRNRSNTIEEIREHGIPVGAMNQSNYMVTQESLHKGDVLLLLTDGMPELQNNKNEMFGYQRLQSSFQKAAEKMPQEIVEYLKNIALQWISNSDLEDDVTFVVIKVK